MGSRSNGAGITTLAAKILGGDLASSVTSSVGEPRVNADLLVNSARFGPIGVNVTDANTNLSDFFVQSFVGWQAGNLHGWDLSATAGFTFNQTNTATDYKTVTNSIWSGQ